MTEDVEVFHSTYLSTVYDSSVKKVATIYDMIPEIYQSEFGDRWTEELIRQKAAVVRNADRVTCISATTKNDLLRYFPWLPEQKVAVVRPAFSRDDFFSDLSFESVTKRYGLRVRPHEYFIFVGNREGYKNFDILVRLVSRFSRWRDSVFVCVGGEEPGEVTRQIEGEGLSENFIFVKYVADNELGVLYRNSLALVNPSLYEGFSLPLVEAMGCDCPVVCSNTPAMCETAGDAALYFEPRVLESLDEALGRVVGSDGRALIQKGRARVNEYSWEDSVNGILDVYNELV
jgi:glycosyltransferase involved in cell wall biosynthesis